jgi:drug/metabolite transporter (DMT)-like permease
MPTDLDSKEMTQIDRYLPTESAPSRRAGGESTSRFRLAFAVGCTIILWASAFVAIRIGLTAYKPTQLAAMRYLVASLILGMRALFARVEVPKRGDIPRLVLTGLLGFSIYATLLNYGETKVSAGLSSFIVYTVPIFTAILAVALLHEKMGVKGWIGLGLSLSGTALMAFATDRRLRFEPNVLTLLGAAIVLALYFTLQKKLVQQYGALTVTSWAVWLSAVVMAPFLPFKSMLTAPSASTIAVVYLGVFPTVVAYSAWAYVVARLPVARAAAYLYSVPAVATLMGFIFLSERPSVLAILGGLIATAGVALVNLRSR